MLSKPLNLLVYSFSLVLLLIATAGCGETQEPVCEPGEQEPCSCLMGDGIGLQTYLPDGDGWSSCECEESSDPSEPEPQDDPSDCLLYTSPSPRD